MANTSNTVNLPNYTINNTSITNGALLTSNGFNGTSWTNTSINYNSVMTIPSGGDKVVIDEKAALEVKGKILINGLDLEERLKTIEKVLMIPERDATMEAKYPSLKKKYDEYIKDLSKYRMWETIKGDNE